MQFEVGEEAAALRDAVAQLLAREVPGAVVRAAWPGGDREAVDRAWQKLAGVGTVGVLVPEESGGLGLDETSMAPTLEAVGYSGLPGPVVETIAVAGPLLTTAGASCRDAVLDGRETVTAQLDGDLLPYCQFAQLAVLRRDRTLRLHRIADLALEPCQAVDGARGVSRLTADPGPGQLLTDDERSVHTAWQRGVLGTSAVLVGLAARALQMTVDYVKQRHQFGVPIGSFQAVKHALASALLAVEFARPVVLAAAWAQANDAPDADALTSSGKVLASDAARLVARTAIQCHGAMGYTTEYDLHLFVKQIWALASTWGDPGWHRARIGERLGV